MNALPKVNLFAEAEAPERDRILLLPGYLFFVESIPLAEDLSPEDTESLAVLTLEGMTPFPLEQLSWGYTVDKKTRHLLLFAAYQERLKAAGYPNLEPYRQAYPDFIALDNSGADAPQTHILSTPEGLTAASFEAGARFPSEVAALPPPPPPDEEAPENKEDAEAAPSPDFESLNADYDKARYPLGRSLEGPVEGRVNETGTLFFNAPQLESTMPASAIWTADLRPESYARKIRSERRRDQLLWRILTYAAGLTLALLLLEGFRFGSHLVIQNRNQQIEQRADEVNQLAARNELVNRLELRASGQLRPFTTLQVMNRTRPSSIYFTTIEAGEFNRFEVEGIASNPNEVNQYVQTLRNTGYFESVEQQNNRVVSGKVTFTLRLVIDELPATQTQVATNAPTPAQP